MRIRPLFEGLGAAILLLGSDYLSLLQPQNHGVFHHGLPVTNLVEGLLIDILVSWILLTGILMIADRLQGNLRKYAGLIFASVIVWKLIAFLLASLCQSHLRFRQTEILWKHWAVYLVFLLAVIAAHFSPWFADQSVCAVRVVMACLAFSAIWIIPRLVVIAASHPYQAETKNLAPAPPQTEQRIVWILFDELSYAETFESRAPGIELPSFDQVRSASTSFSQVKPIGFYTDRIIPSLFLGTSFSEYESTSSGELFYEDNLSKKWTRFDSNLTLFGLAKRNGWNPAIDDWFNPSCLTLSQVLSACDWSHDSILPSEDYGASEEKSAFTNSAAALSQLSSFFTQTTPDNGPSRIKDYREVMARAGTLINDDRYRFIYIHLPIPHPPGIYDRQLHLLRSRGTYLDNMVLADQALAVLYQQINASPLAGRTVLFVTSDHSWRIQLYRGLQDWTGEEESASRGTFDDRPVLLVHFPNQSTPGTFSAPASEMIEHELIAEVLDGQIVTQQDFNSAVSTYVADNQGPRSSP